MISAQSASTDVANSAVLKLVTINVMRSQIRRIGKRSDSLDTTPEDPISVLSSQFSVLKSKISNFKSQTHCHAGKPFKHLGLIDSTNANSRDPADQGPASFLAVSASILKLPDPNGLGVTPSAT